MIAIGDRQPEESFVANAFGRKPIAPGFPLCYPFICIIEEGAQRRLSLEDAFQETMRTLSRTGGEPGATTSQPLLPPSWRQLLRQFLIPSPEEIADMKEELVKLRKESERLRTLDETNRKLLKIVRGFGLGRKGDLNIPAAEESIEEFQEFFFNLPDSTMKPRVRNALRRAGLIDLSEIRQMLKVKGKIQRIRGIDEKSEEFLRQALRITQQKASP